MDGYDRLQEKIGTVSVCPHQDEPCQTCRNIANLAYDLGQLDKLKDITDGKYDYSGVYGTLRKDARAKHS